MNALSDAWCNCTVSTDQCPARPWASDWNALLNSPQINCSAICYGIYLWPVWAICPSCAPSHLLVPPASLLAQADESLAWCKLCLAMTERSVCYHHFSYPIPKRQPVPATENRISPHKSRTAWSILELPLSQSVWRGALEQFKSCVHVALGEGYGSAVSTVMLG